MHQEVPKRLSLYRIYLRIALALLLTVAVLFTAAGRLDWLMAWVYVSVLFVCIVTSTCYLSYKDPDLLAERSRLGPGAKKWDIVLVYLMALVFPMLSLLVAGLDDRFGWSPPFPILLRFTGLPPMLLGHLLIHSAMASNTFFAPVVRIQKERGHRVIRCGPYRYLRHPGYVGAILFYGSVPLILGSWWAYIPTGLFVCVTVIRTAMEDNTLQNELEGYRKYTQEVRFRLVPGLW